MSLINSLKNNDGNVSLKWCYCKVCEMEWLVPDIPDAIPEYCCHCKHTIDTTLQPGDVLMDVEFSKVERDGDVGFEAVHRTTLSLDESVEFRVYPIEELQEDDDDEVIACGHRIDMLISEATTCSFDVPHETLLRLVGYLFRYLASAGDELDIMMGNPLLDQFKRYRRLQDWKDDGE